MNALLLLCALPIYPQDVNPNEVFMIEDNQVYDMHGRKHFRQWIFWNEAGGVIDWIGYKNSGEPIKRDGKYRMLVQKHQLFTITSEFLIRTDTHYDREVAARANLDVSGRLKLIEAPFPRGLSNGESNTTTARSTRRSYRRDYQADFGERTQSNQSR